MKSELKAFVEKLQPKDGYLLYCKERVDHEYTFNWHSHEEYELTLIVRGQGRRFVGDNISSIGPGDLVLLGSSLPHTYVAPFDPDMREHRAIVIHFTDAVFAGLGVEHLAPGPVRRLLDRGSRGLCFSPQTVASVTAQLTDMLVMSPVRQLATLLLVIESLAEDDKSAEISSGLLKAAMDEAVSDPFDRVKNFVNKEFREEISLPQAAAVAAMSISTFCRLFKKNTGKTFTDYVNELRIAQACRLLATGEGSVSEIANSCGFRNLSHFNERFFRSKGMQPRQYRMAFFHK